MRKAGRFLLVLELAAVVTAAACATAGGGSQEAAFTARKRLARELVGREEWPAAFAHLDELHRQQPKDPEVLTLRGIVFRERKLIDEAEADLRAALAADDKNAEAHAALGIVLDSSGRGVEAEGHHRRAVSLVGNSAAYLNNLGFSLLIRRKSKEALEVLQKSVRLDPTSRRLRTNLGFAYAATGDFSRAAREFDLGADPAEAKNNLGFAYESRGDLPNAYAMYLEALRLDPRCARAQGNLRHVAERTGRPLPPELSAVEGPHLPQPSSTAEKAKP